MDSVSQGRIVRMATLHATSEVLLIYPEQALDLDTTVRELFAEGPLIVRVHHTGPDTSVVVVDAPALLRVHRQTMAALEEAIP